MFSFKFPFFKKEKADIPLDVLEPTILRSVDIIAPSSIDISSNYLKISERFSKSYFIFSFPRYLTSAWLSPLINLTVPLDISFHIHPIDTGSILNKLRKKVAMVQAEMMEREQKGLIREPSLEIAYQDLEDLRTKLQSAQERMFRFGLYITTYSDNEKELKEIEDMLRSIFESRLIYIKPATFQQKEGFASVSPYGLDNLMVHTPMNTTPLSSSFPFISFDLSANEGILYGVNRHNNSLVLFDRFSLENFNLTIFGISGSGKSYVTKLEILRSLMMGLDVIILDPENEYEFLSETIGGAYFKISLSADYHINPFDLPIPNKDETAIDVLRSSIINLVGLLRLMLGGLTPEEDGIIDTAITETYAAKDITPDSDPNKWQENIPLMSDFEDVLEGMEGAENLIKKLKRFTSGTYSGFFNQPTNITMKNKLVVFGIRDMEEELRPMAMFIIMRYIWNTVRREFKKRILVIDEAWWMMKNEDSASFLFGLVKRGRKYWLGLTTITQDVPDFMRSVYGQPIIANSSLHILMKTSTAAIDAVQKTFNLTEEERMILLETQRGEGLFIAGNKRVIIDIQASYTEDQIITTSPEEIAKIKMARKK